jgi:hypothetical protein
MSNLGAFVAIALFIIGQTLALLKWMSNNSKGLAVLATKFDERTEAMSKELENVNETLKVLALADARIAAAERAAGTADLRVGVVERVVADHEMRLRDLEKKG